MKHAYAAPSLLLAAAVQNCLATPIPMNDSVSLTQGTAVVIPVLANDLPDPEAPSDIFIQTDPATVFYGGFLSPGYGTAVVNEDNTVTYTPNDPSFTGQDSFTYLAEDETGYGSALVSIQVVPATGEGLEGYAVGGTNKAVGRMLDGLCDGESAYEQLGFACSQLADAEVADLNAWLREIAPEEALTQRGLLMENSRNKTARLYRALAQTKGGGASLSINDRVLPFGGAAGDDLGSPWTLLSSIQIGDFERGETDNQAGYDSNSRGLMVGLGYRLSPGFNFGAAFDWNAYDVDYRRNSGDLDSDLYSLTSFFNWYRGDFGLDLQTGYTQGDSRSQRRFTFPSTAYADSRYDSRQVDVSSQLDWSKQAGAWSLRPFLRVDYVKSEIDAFTETGSSLWLVAAEKQTHEQLNTSAGLATTYTINFSWGVLVPGATLSLVNQANLHNSPVAFQLLYADSGLGGFELRADSPDSLFYQWDLDTVLILANGLSTFVGVQALSDYDHVTAYQLRGGVNWEF